MCIRARKIISDFEYQTAVNQLMSAKASLAQAEASLVSANQNLSFCTVTRPSNGVVEMCIRDSSDSFDPLSEDQ